MQIGDPSEHGQPTSGGDGEMRGPGHALPKWEANLLRVLEVPIGIMLIGMMLLVTANALGRRLWGLQIPATLELNQFWMMPLIASVGIFIAYLRGEHIVADLFYSGFPDTGKKWLSVATNILVGIVLCAFTFFTGQSAIDAMGHGVHAGSTDIIAWPAHFVSPVALGAYALMVIIDAARLVGQPPSSFSVDLEEEAMSEVREWVPEESGVDSVEAAEVPKGERA